MASPAANNVVKALREGAGNVYLQKCARISLVSGKPDISYLVQPGDTRVPPRTANEAIQSGWLAERDPGLFPGMPQAWVYQERKAVGRAVKTKETPMPKFHVEIARVYKQRANTLRGFADITIRELHLLIRGLTVHQDGESHWVSLPTKANVDKDGNAARDHNGAALYFPVLVFTHRATREAFVSQVVERLVEYDPTIFD